MPSPPASSEKKPLPQKKFGKKGRFFLVARLRPAISLYRILPLRNRIKRGGNAVVPNVGGLSNGFFLF